ncbi:MAG TPA: hypothetical protein PKC72_03270 [Chitinophagaceae bacterium]|nr:hypothetical protein [Chitinophagaceae bacterium]
MMPQQKFMGSPKKLLQAMRIFTIALLTGVLLFSIIMIVVVQSRGPALVPDIFSGVVVITAIAALFAAHFLYRKKLTEIKNAVISLQEKLNLYRSSLILYLAFCEGAGLLSVIVFFLTGNYYLLVITAILLLFMYSKFPSVQKLSGELNLDSSERMQLE